MLELYVAVVLRYVVLMNKIYGTKQAKGAYQYGLGLTTAWEFSCAFLWLTVYDRVTGQSTAWANNTRHLIIIGILIAIFKSILLNKKVDLKDLQLTSFKQIGTRTQRVVSALYYWIMLVLTASAVFLNFWIG